MSRDDDGYGDVLPILQLGSERLLDVHFMLTSHRVAGNFTDQNAYLTLTHQLYFS